MKLGSPKVEKEKTYLTAFGIRDELKIAPKPSYTYNIGDSVYIGHLEDVKIVEVYEDGLCYKVEYRKEKDKEKHTGFWMWYDIRPLSKKPHSSLIKNRDFNIYYSQRAISGLFSVVYHFGLNTSPIYQRDYVWSDKDKEALIDSIFHNVDIGKFTFIHIDYNETKNYSYEIMDGKQRLKAITDFYENRFPYKGLYYNDLSREERNHFLSYNINFGELNDMPEEEKYKTFILLNTAGKPVDTAQIEFVKELYHEVTKRDLE